MLALAAREFAGKNMIEILITTLQKNKCDIVECNFKKFRYQDEILETEDVLNQKEFAAEDAIENLITGNLKQVVWNKIYSKRILTEEFVTGRINEDEFWTYKILGNITSLIKIDKVLYFYRQQDNSIMNQKFNVKRLDGLIALEERISYLKEHYPKLEHLAIKHFCFQSMYIFQKLNKIEKIQKKKSLLLEIHANMTKYQFKKFHQSLTLKSLIWIKAFCSFPFFVSRIRNRFNIGV